MNGRSTDKSPSSKESEAAGELQPINQSSSTDNDDGDGGNEKSSDYGDIVQQFAEETSLPGLPRVILARSRLSRYFWIFICLTCAISFGVGIYQLLERYFSYNKKVTVEMVSEPVSFPHVTLCNMRSIDFDVLIKINEIFRKDSTVLSFVGNPTGDPFVDAYINFVAKFSNMWYDEASANNTEVVDALNEAISRVSLYNDIPREVISHAGIQLDQYVARCFMGGSSCNLVRDFRQFFDQYYFNCYTFDPSAARTSKNIEDLPWLSPGVDNGLTLVVLTGSGMLEWNAKANIIPGLYDMGSATAGSDGVRVVIHAPDVVPFPLAEGFDVPPGFSVSFGVRPRRNVRIGPPHGDCVSVNPFDKKPEEDEQKDDEQSKKRRPYRQLVCQKQCVQQHIKKACDCLDETLLRPPSDYEDAQEEFDDTPLCHDTKHFPKTCLKRAAPECFEALLLQSRRVRCAERTRARVRSSREMMTECGCRAACDELLYDVSYSISRWPAARYEGDAVHDELLTNPAGALFLDRFSEWPAKMKILEEYLNQTKTDRIQALRDFARINVYVSDPEVIVTTESEDYDISTLVSDIGGQLGVWIGLSVITAAEVIELMLQIFGRCAKQKRQSKRQQSSKKASAS